MDERLEEYRRTLASYDNDTVWNILENIDRRLAGKRYDVVVEECKRRNLVDENLTLDEVEQKVQSRLAARKSAWHRSFSNAMDDTEFVVMGSLFLAGGLLERTGAGWWALVPLLLGLTVAVVMIFKWAFRGLAAESNPRVQSGAASRSDGREDGRE